MGAFFIQFYKFSQGKSAKIPKGESNMSKKWLTYDLQFFADGGGEESESAEQTEVDGAEESENTEETEATEGEESEEQQTDRDSIYAAARRRAESEAKNRYEKEQGERDRFFADLCKGRVNPETNEPITNEAEYIEAMQAMQRVNINNQLTEKGIDPAVIEQMLAQNPTLKQAQRVIEEAKDREAQAQIREDIKNILELDKNYSNEDELVKSDEFQKAIEYCNATPGIRLSDAYKIVNFDSLRSVSVKAAKQAAINEAKGKGHLTAPNTPTGKGAVEIPEADLSKWKRMFPSYNRNQLNALYAKVHSN
jgi:hypothetical protein